MGSILCSTVQYIKGTKTRYAEVLEDGIPVIRVCGALNVPRTYFVHHILQKVFPRWYVIHLPASLVRRVLLFTVYT